MTTLSNQIKCYREAAGLSQQQLADAVGINRTTLLRIESEKYRMNVTVGVLKRISTHLHVRLVIEP